MSLVRPTLAAPPAFDATTAYTFTFFVAQGGAQVASNQLTIRDNTTNNIVYQQTQTTFQYQHTVPANTLTNGTNYNAVVITYDASGTASEASIPVQFWCYTTPTLQFTNIPTGNIIPNASFSFAFSYSQTQSEALNSYELNLYSSSGVLVSTSGVQYTASSTVPYNGTYLFAGFEDGTTYGLELIGTTIEGTSVTSGRISITAKYTQPAIYTLMTLTNNCEGGYVNIQSNIVLIEGTSNPSPPVYISGTEVDLTEEGSYVAWNDGYSISGDMLTRLWFRNPTANSTLLTFSNTAGETITLSYNQGYANDDRTTTLLCYMTATVTSAAGAQYFIYSGYIPILDSTAYYNVWLTRIGGIYQLQFAAA